MTQPQRGEENSSLHMDAYACVYALIRASQGQGEGGSKFIEASSTFFPLFSNSFGEEPIFLTTP